MINIDLLNDKQKEAVLRTKGPLLVLAGAGSGKTRVLTYRIAHIIENGTPPWKILAITFTNKAAREMKERVESLNASASEAWVSTFHSCCSRILRRDIEKLGYNSSFTIYDDDDSISLIKQIEKKAGIPDKIYTPRLVKTSISDAKNRLLTPAEWFNDSKSDPKARTIYEIFKEYEKQLKANNALDFDDLLMKTLELFAYDEAVLKAYQDRFDYILVDEYQDTNTAQYQLVKLLAGDKCNVCVVGDDDQSIYGWRGADIRNILDFEKDFKGCKVIKLEQNYRSTQTILDAANQVIVNNKDRKDKALWTDKGEGGKIRLYRALDERDEAAYIANTIQKMSSAGIKPGDCAVLYRTNAQSRVIEEALVRTGVPYSVYGGMKFYDRKEVKDIIAYMRVLTNPDDNVAFERIINVPKRAIGDASVQKLREFAEAQEINMFSASCMADAIDDLKPKARQAIASFAELMMSLTASAFTDTPDAFLERLLDESGVMAALEADTTDEGKSRIENVNELRNAIKEFCELNSEATLRDYLENVALISDLDSLDEKTTRVTLMTVHAAKGLEFPAVFIAGLEDGIFPTSRSFYEDDKLEEERRLMYVAITRAKTYLFLIHAQNRLQYGDRKFNEPSRFLSEIPLRLIDDVRNRTTGKNVSLPPVSHPNRRDTYSTAKKIPLSEITGIKKGFFASQAQEIKAETLFNVGDRVRHKMFGVGTVIEITDGAQKKMRIVFDDGSIKQFMVNTAPVIKI